jgi:hypothetical protein
MTSSTIIPAGEFISPAARASSVFFNSLILTIISPSRRFRQRLVLAQHCLCPNLIAFTSPFHIAAVREQRYASIAHNHEASIDRTYLRKIDVFAFGFVAISSFFHKELFMSTDAGIADLRRMEIQLGLLDAGIRRGMSRALADWMFTSGLTFSFSLVTSRNTNQPTRTDLNGNL